MLDHLEFLADPFASGTAVMDDDEHACPACRTINPPYGTLGKTVHYRCRDCGMGYSVGDD